MTLSPGKLDKNKLKMQKRYVTPQHGNFPNLSMSDHMYQDHKTPMKPRGKLPSLNLDNQSELLQDLINPLDSPEKPSKKKGIEGSALINAINKNKFDHKAFHKE